TLHGGLGNDLLLGDGRLDYAQLAGDPAAGDPPGLSATALSTTLGALKTTLTFYGVPLADDTAGDLIYGDDDPDAPTGDPQSGNDVLFGSNGADVIFGGAGSDRVNGRGGL